MRRHDDEYRSSSPAYLFISYSPLDELWATWIAWELETAGFRTMLQAWDFVAGTNFIDYMDRGVSRSAAVIAVLSRHYMKSRYGRLEWQTALRREPDDPARRLITVRVDDFPLEGLLSTITFVDLVAVVDADVARERLLRHVRHALNGRAKPAASPRFPPSGPPLRLEAPPITSAPGRPHRLAGRPPAIYPPVRAAEARESGITLLHLRGPMFGAAGERPVRRADELVETVDESVRWWESAGGARPDAVVVTGHLTRSGGIREFDEALDFVLHLRMRLGLQPHRLAIVPGSTDVTRAACRAYFATCEADEVEPRRPYWPKWRHFCRFLDAVYDGVDGFTFDEGQPWSLYEMADLQLVVAGVNSTMAISHQPDDDYGWVGVAQARWFAERLRGYAAPGWVRIAATSYEPDKHALRDAETFHRYLGDQLDTVLYAPTDGPGTEAVGTVLTITRLDDGKSVAIDDRPLMAAT